MVIDIKNCKIKVRKYMQYEKFVKLGDSHWWTNGTTCMHLELCNISPIRYSKYACVNYLRIPVLPGRVRAAINKANKWEDTLSMDITGIYNIQEIETEKEGLVKIHSQELTGQSRTHYFNSKRVGYLFYLAKEYMRKHKTELFACVNLSNAGLPVLVIRGSRERGYWVY